MKHRFSINAEGGPLLCLDAQAAKQWMGCAAGQDYEGLCARFDATPGLLAIRINVGGQPSIAWEMGGPGTADVFSDESGLIRIVRPWVDKDTPGELAELAATHSSDVLDIGEIAIPSCLLAVLWAVEEGSRVPMAIEGSIQKVPGTTIDDSAWVLKTTHIRYRCQHDEIVVGSAQARRLTLLPV
jgi:hypothetical protein